jgi:hypothetical protein
VTVNLLEGSEVIKKLIVGSGHSISAHMSNRDQLVNVIHEFRKDTSIGLKEAKDFVLWVFDHGTPGQVYSMTDANDRTAGIKVDNPFPLGSIIRYIDNGKLGRVENLCSDTCEKLNCTLMGDGQTRYNLPIIRMVLVAIPGTELAECYRLLNAAATRRD